MQQALAGFLRESGLGRRMAEQRILGAWKAAAGPRFGPRTEAVGFRDGALQVEVQSAAHLQELRNFLGEQLRQATNRALGDERIRRIVFQLKR